MVQLRAHAKADGDEVANGNFDQHETEVHRKVVAAAMVMAGQSRSLVTERNTTNAQIRLSVDGHLAPDN